MQSWPARVRACTASLQRAAACAGSACGAVLRWAFALASNAHDALACGTTRARVGACAPPQAQTGSSYAAPSPAAPCWAQGLIWSNSSLEGGSAA